MARRGYGSDVSVDRYADRDDRSHVSRGGGRRYDDRFFEEDVYRSSRGPPPRERERERERERDLLVREEVVERERAGPPPAFLQEGYGRSTAGPVVLRKRETEDFEFAPRLRSPSPEPERKIEKEEIIIRRDESESRPPPRRREASREREEIIIRREEKDSRDDLRYPPGREDREREEIIIRRDERDRSRDFRPPAREERDREEIIIRRDERKDDDLVSRRGDFERDEIIIRRDERDSDDRTSRADRDRYALTRPISHERERSRHRGGNESDDEIIIRRDQREGGRRGDHEREDIIIRHRSRSNSPSSPTVSGRYPPPGLYPPAVYPPPIIQVPREREREDAISRAIDRDYEITLTPRRPISRPPSPPSPPRERERSAERIAIHRSGERNGREYNEDIVIDRNDTRSRSPLPPPGLRDPYNDYPSRPGQPTAGPLVPHRGYDRSIEEEASYYNDIAKQRGYVGEGYHGSTRDWALVDVPPGTRRVRMDGAGGGEQEITWQRYNGVRRSQFYPDGPNDEGYGSEVGRPMPLPAAGGGLGAAYGRPRDARDGLWTEITKDLVVKEALKEMDYEYEETDDFFYVFKYLSYVSPHKTIHRDHR